MSNINLSKLIMHESKIMSFKKIIEESLDLTDEQASDSRIVIREYYQYINDPKVPYGKAALSVINDEWGFGSFANLHLITRARSEGKKAKEIEDIQNILPIKLAYSDISMRISIEKREIGVQEEYKAIALYHYKALKDVGLSNHAWGGALFEEFVGSGSWMQFTDNELEYKIDGNLIKSIWSNKEINEVKARTAFLSLLDTEEIERGMEYVNQDALNWANTAEGQRYYIGDEEIAFADTFYKTSSGQSIYSFIRLISKNIAIEILNKTLDIIGGTDQEVIVYRLQEYTDMQGGMNSEFTNIPKTTEGTFYEELNSQKDWYMYGDL